MLRCEVLGREVSGASFTHHEDALRDARMVKRLKQPHHNHGVERVLALAYGHLDGVLDRRSPCSRMARMRWPTLLRPLGRPFGLPDSPGL